MKAIFDAGVKEISKNGIDEKDGFIFPSYVEDILGPELFDYGYGPFRWVCLSNDPKDLEKTDKAAMDCIDPNRRGQDRDNYIWIRDAQKNKLVVGALLGLIAVSSWLSAYVILAQSKQINQLEEQLQHEK